LVKDQNGEKTMRALSILALVTASTLAAGCAAEASSDDDAESLGTAASAITPIPIPEGYMDPSYYSITPIPIPGARPIYGDFTLDASGITYLSQRWTTSGSVYSAVRIGFDGTPLGESQAFPGVPKNVKNLVLTPEGAVFGDGAKTVLLPMNPFVKPSVRYTNPDPWAPEVHGNGMTPLADGSFVDVFTYKGFAWSKLYSTPRCGPDSYDCGYVAGDMTPGHRGFWQVGEKTLKNVAIGESGASVTSNCSLGWSTYSFLPSSPITSAKDEETGRVHVAAQLTDGRLVECRGSLGSSGYRILQLPFKGIADFSFDGGGGVAVDGGGGVGKGNLWVAASSYPYLAYLPAWATDAATVKLTSAASGTAEYNAAMPRMIRTLGQSAFVLTADRRILRVDHR
jgi:hypothetical protein